MRVFPIIVYWTGEQTWTASEEIGNPGFSRGDNSTRDSIRWRGLVLLPDTLTLLGTKVLVLVYHVLCHRVTSSFTLFTRILIERRPEESRKLHDLPRL